MANKNLEDSNHSNQIENFRPLGFKKEKGQGLVEFALTMPILLLVFMGMFEFGRLLFVFIMVSSSSREAARYGVATGSADVVDSGTRRYYDCTGIRNAALNIGQFISMTSSDIVISYDSGPGGSTVFADCATLAAATTDVSLGDRIVVTVTYTYTPIAQYAGFNSVPTFNIVATSNRTILRPIPLTGYGGSVSGATSTAGGATSTPSTIPAPAYVSMGETPNFNDCDNVWVSWTAASSWSTWPGGSPSSYNVDTGGGYSVQSSPTNIGDMLDNATTTVYIKALFGAQYTEVLTVNVKCENGGVSIP